MPRQCPPSGAPRAAGWGTAIRTDTAFVVGGLALLGTRVPVSLRLFILSLAVFDDVGAVLIVAVVYGGPLSLPALAIAGGLVVLVLVLARAGFRSVPVGVIAMCWLAERARFATRPADLSWSVIAAASVLTGIGFTMSIFMTKRRRHGLVVSAEPRVGEGMMRAI